MASPHSLDTESQKLRNFFRGGSSPPRILTQQPDSLGAFFGLPHRRTASGAGLTDQARPPPPAPTPQGAPSLFGTRSIQSNSLGPARPAVSGVVTGVSDTVLEARLSVQLFGHTELRRSQILANARAVANMLEKGFPLYALH